MKIIVNNESSHSIIDTESTSCISEVMDMFIAALIQDGYQLTNIRYDVELWAKEFDGIIKE